METKSLFKPHQPDQNDTSKILLRNEAFFSQPDLYHYLDAFPDLTAVLNKEQKVIYANKALLAFLQITLDDEICTIQPGDLFHCLHARESEEGCGSAEQCHFCGAAHVIRIAQETRQSSQKECMLRTKIGGQEKAYNFSVTATPFIIANTEYTLLSFRDINLEKQKLALERIFFHDILNTISSLQVNIELLKRSPAESNHELITKIESISQMLIEEINSQKMLVSAENKTLKVQKNLILSTQLTREVIDHFKDHDIVEKRKLEIAPFSEAFAFVSDATIIRRVLINMLKNALEASPKETTVTIGFKKENKTVTYWVHNPTYIEKEIQLQVFNRYFSTKGLNRGLGTYSMKLLTEGYLQGQLSFKTDQHDGTTFYVSIPFQDFSG